MPESTLVLRSTPQVSAPELTLATSKVIADTVRQFVSHPDRIATTAHTDGRTVTLVLCVAPDDIGKVIGRQGRTARSLRIILSSISRKTGVNFELDIQAERT
jgi:predicted RNA-binding protein YlqC (UPF0109 family)